MIDKKVEQSSEKQPFFARFLQNQASEQFPQIQSQIQAGRKLPETMKYPSDRDEI